MIVPGIDNFPTITMTATTTSVAPIPTVVPGSPLFQELHTTGKRTLWWGRGGTDGHLLTGVLLSQRSRATGIPSLHSPMQSRLSYAANPTTPQAKRVFHTLSALITTISFITYLALATGQGIAWKYAHIPEPHKHVPDTAADVFRHVLWLRYVNWALSTPLILINLSLISGLPGANLVAAIAANWVMLASGILGSFAGHMPQRWAWLVLSCIAYLVTLHHGAFHAQRAAQNKDAPTRRFFGAFSGSAFAVLALYPITFAAGTLALRISVDVETILFAIQDIFTQGLLGYWLLLAHDSSQGITLHLDGFWSQGFGNDGAIRIPEEEGA
ncbi:Opsin [Penicillium hispanicum]|uniref:Opsin n=1 Tax=Penicillium hispanicum TaxID=1080232 RepID=UPI0025419669|nr:Opsin [Penicillium hispanicum]KAJ5580298.1 Opsin [Penicillium hispanicum]